MSVDHSILWEGGRDITLEFYLEICLHKNHSFSGTGALPPISRLWTLALRSIQPNS